MRILRWLALALLMLIGVLVFRAASMQSRQVGVEPLEPVAVDADGLLDRFRSGLRIRTISHQGGIGLDEAAFASFRQLLRDAYPRVHAGLHLETINEHSLLYRWGGSDGPGEALVLLAHQDVVPIDEGTESDWVRPPFAAEVADGYLWGRGAIDDKASLFTVLEAVEGLLAQGFVPKQDVYLAFGHDEEVGGSEGAVVIADRLAARGVQVAMVLDEGGSMIDGLLPGLEEPVAVIGVGEKGYLSAVLAVEGEGGHSSAPPPTTHIGRLATAVARVEQHPFPSRLEGPARAFFEEGVGPESPFLLRIFYANLWLFDPLMRSMLDRVPGASGMIRTTTAPTIFQAGLKDNVLPARARAVVNFRVLPGDSTEAVLERTRRIVGDEAVAVTADPKRREPTAISRTDGEAWQTLSRTIREVFPGTVVAPYLMVAGTDSRYFRRLCDCVYQFIPIVVTPDDMRRAHGTNERVPVAGLPDAVRFYRRLIQNVAG